MRNKKRNTIGTKQHQQKQRWSALEPNRPPPHACLLTGYHVHRHNNSNSRSSSSSNHQPTCINTPSTNGSTTTSNDKKAATTTAASVVPQQQRQLEPLSSRHPPETGRKAASRKTTLGELSSPSTLPAPLRAPCPGVVTFSSRLVSPSNRNASSRRRDTCCRDTCTPERRG